MNNLKEYYIKDIASIKSGKRLPKGHILTNEITNLPYIKARDIRGGKVREDQLQYLLEETHKKIKRYIVETNDVCITIVANIGDVGIVPTSLSKANLTENAVRLTNIKEFVSPKYLCQLLSAKFFKEYMELLSAGAAQSKLGIYKIEKIKVQLPPLPIQERIASILSAYDDLIEVNNQRIKLLEQTARELYKEWFVRMRFPNYKKAKVVKGLPQDWEIKELQDFGKIFTGKTPPTKVREYYGGEIPFIKTPDLHKSLYVFDTQENLTEKGNNTQKRSTLPKDSICVSCIGTGGIVSITTAEKSQTNQQINSLVLKDIKHLEFLFHKIADLKETIELFGGTGATMTNLSKGKFEKLKVLFPKKELVVV